MICPFCGKDIPDDSMFCTSCGQKIDGATTAPESVTEPDPAAAPEVTEPIASPVTPEAAPQQPEPGPVVPDSAAYADAGSAKRRGRGPIIAIAAVAVIVVIGLVAAFVVPSLMGPSSEEIIREGVASQFEMLMDPNSEDYREMVEDLDDSAGLGQFGVSGEEFVGSMLDGLDYDITAVEVDEANDEAVCYVTMTCKSFADIMPRLEQRMSELVNDPSVYTMDTDDLYDLLGDEIMQAVDETELHDVDLELEFERDDEGVWSEDDSVEDEVASALLS